MLLRLDGLQGLHPDVRLIRKALAKEIIRFQETIDSMSIESKGHDHDHVLTAKERPTEVISDDPNLHIAPEVADELDARARAVEANWRRFQESMDSMSIKTHTESNGLDIHDVVTVKGRASEVIDPNLYIDPEDAEELDAWRRTVLRANLRILQDWQKQQEGLHRTGSKAV